MITPNNRFFNQQWGLRLIKAPEAWQLLNGGSQILTGNGNEVAFGSPNINVTIVDTGIETKNGLAVHESFKGQINNNTSKLIKHIVNVRNLSFDFDDYMNGNHGMGVSGIALAKAQINMISAYNGSAIIGVAPNCGVYSLTSPNSLVFRFILMLGLANTEITKSPVDDLNRAYNILTNQIGPGVSYKKSGTSDEGEPLGFFLNNTFTDIFNLSIQITASNNSLNLEAENYSKVIFNELTFFGRSGRGCVIVVGAGNDSLNIEPSPNQFLNEMAFSNKPIIVGAVSVDNGYNWLTSNPLPHPRKSSYSNFGNRIDVCAPGGGGTTSGQEDNTIFTTTVKGSGELLNNSPLRLSLKFKKFNVIYSNPPLSNTHYAKVQLEFDNLNGVYVGQHLVIGNFSGISSYEIFNVEAIASNAIEISHVKQSTFNSLIDSANSTSSSPRTMLEFTPLYTKITQIFPGNRRLIEVETVKGAYPGANIYIGSLGDFASGSKRLIASGGIDASTNQITLTSNVNANVGDYIVFPLKSSRVANMYTSGTTKIIVQDVEGFFVGGTIAMESSNPTSPFYTEGTISSIEVPTRTLNFSKPLIFSGPLPLPSVDINAKSIGTGDITKYFNGTSAATPFVSGVAALILSANKFLSAAEVKHIIKETASSSVTITGAGIPPYALNTDGYQHSTYYGTGLLDAEAAVQLALNWHNAATQKPVLKLFDIYGGTTVPETQSVNSPDIWIKPIAESATPLPSEAQPFKSFDTGSDQKIFVRIRNIGNRKSFKECDVRVFVAFTNESNPTFPFPNKWFHKIDLANDDPVINQTLHDNVILLGIKEIPIILPNAEVFLDFEWKSIQKNWNSWNPLNKKAYLLAHIAPFDGIEAELSLINIRNNKNLTCKPIDVTHFNSFIIASNGTKTSLPDDIYNLTVNPIAVSKSFIFEVSNILESRLNALKFTFVRKNRVTGTIEQTVIYRKSGGSWSFNAAPTANWIKIEPAIAITASLLSTPNYKNAILNFILTVDETVLEITCDVST